jgi:acetoacetyl-CoA synthetase
MHRRAPRSIVATQMKADQTTSRRADPPVVWRPTADMLEHSEMSRLLEDAGVDDYNALWRWSVADLPRFWRWVWDRYDVQSAGDPTVVLRSDSMPGARWFPDVTVSFPEHVFRGKADTDVALRFAREEGPLRQWTWGELRHHTARVRAGLEGLGVRPGDRVVGYLPNGPETLVAFLATAALGATWSCCSPDLGARTVIDRFAQIEPKVLLAVDDYRYGGRSHDRVATIADIVAGLPSLEHVRRMRGEDAGRGWEGAFPSAGAPLRFRRVAFDHPLWIVFSSGTTGLPKAIVHGHGGPLLEHLKTWRLHHDVRGGDCVLWYTTSGWIMWNYLIGALLAPVSVVLFDGHPGHPHVDALWDVCDQAGATLFGAGAAYFHACMANGVQPRRGRRLERLRAIGSTGSPLAAEAYTWVQQHLGGDIWLSSISGGTDVAGAFLGGAPLVSVHAGELPARMLGVAIEAWDDDGRSVVDDVGELVVTAPMPSMPVGLWGDPDGSRLRETYFSHYDGVWRHGDWLRLTSRGSAVIHGRSDATINRGGVRMGTAELYVAARAVTGVVDALVVDLPAEEGTGLTTMIMFVVLAEGQPLDDELSAEIRRRIRRDCSPRHVPDAIVEAPAVPRTLTGKLLEVPVKRVLMGRPAGAAPGALEDPRALAWFEDFALRQRDGPGRGPTAP